VLCQSGEVAAVKGSFCRDIDTCIIGPVAVGEAIGDDEIEDGARPVERSRKRSDRGLGRSRRQRFRLRNGRAGEDKKNREDGGRKEPTPGEVNATNFRRSRHF
jgi:hypothetical protein